jgi:hypothetical protein
VGYKKQPKRYHLKFEDHPGLEVTVGSITTDRFLELSRLIAKAGKDPAADVASGVEATGKVLDMFAAALVSWNLEDDGGPVPPTRAGAGAQDFEFLLELITAWMDAVASVDSPLNTPSPSTPPSGLGLSEATVPLSPSPGS